jgi:hypothetical protein
MKWMIQTLTSWSNENISDQHHRQHEALTHTLNQLSATSPRGLLTTMKRLSLAKPLILHEKKTSIIIKDQVTKQQI